MSFSVRCDCGKDTPVSETDAGASLDCACGRTVRVPALSELKRQAGLPAFKARAADQIAYMLAQGELPLAECAECDQLTEDTLDAIAVCERVWRKGSSSEAWHLLLFFFSPLIWSIWWMFYRQKTAFGRDLEVCMPLRLCHGCRGPLRVGVFVRIFRWLKWLSLAGGLGLLVFGNREWVLLLALAAGAWCLEKITRRRHRTIIQRMFGRVSVYRQLFEEYPEAEFYFQK